MSSMSLTFSGSIIGISYGEMNSVKSNLRRANDMLQQSQSKINSAKAKVQIDRSSSRLRLSEEQISTIYTNAAKQKTKIDKLCNNIDITIRKFKEVDARCAARIRSISKSYDKSKSLWERIKSAVSSFSTFAMNGFKSLIDMGKEALTALGQKIGEGFNAVSEWMDKHPVITNVVSGALDVLAIAGTTAAIVAGTVTGVGIVVAVVGAVYAASTLIDSGVKIYNNIKNGTNSGFNFIEEGFKKVMGDKAGEVAFGVTNLIALAVNLPSMAKGALKLGTGAINFFKEGEGIAKIGASISSIGGSVSSFLDEGKSAFKALGEVGTNKLSNFLESVKDVKNNIGKTLDEIKINIRSIEDSLVYETKGSGNNNHFYEFIDNRSFNTPDNYNFSDVDEVEHIAKGISNDGKISNEIKNVLNENNISIEEFQRMKLTPVDELTEREKNILYYIRESIQKPTEDTTMNKVLRIEDIGNYLREEEPFTTISGYVAKYDDVEKIGTDYSDIREGLRLDYKDPTNGKYPYPEDGDSYAVIRFKYDNVTDDLIDIPYGECFYGTNTDPAPCTQNGFLGGRNDTIIPEWKVTDYKKATIQEGAEMFKVTSGEEELIAIFKDGRFRKVN